MLRKYLFAFFVYWAATYCHMVNAASFTYIGTKAVSELNNVLTHERRQFMQEIPPPKGYELPKVSLAKYEVDLFRVEYDSMIPEQDNRPIKTSGLVAIPKGVDGGALPFMSYQHGTVLGKKEVPSYSFLSDDQARYDHSYETRLAVAQFAGNGYVVIAPDYFGMGDSVEPEEYIVKGSRQQACLDLYLASKDWLASTKAINQKGLFLTGWSQGGYATMAFLEKLEEEGIPVTAASPAAGPPDWFAAFNASIYHPTPIDAIWKSDVFSLVTFSWQNYYNKPGLVDELFKPEYIPSLYAIYYRTYKSAEELSQLTLSLSRFDEKKNTYVLDLAMLLKDEYKDPAKLALTQFGKIGLDAEMYRWHYKTPVIMYYGGADEVVSTQSGPLVSAYQKAMGNRNVIASKLVAKANHRATYLTASAKQLGWFNSFIRQ